ncbi:hypothetical protein MTO96_037916 [Rhipicephalus appendiculatus]
MIAGGREQRRMTMPLSALMHYMSKPGTADNSVVFDETKGKALDFSGKGAFFFSRTMQDSDYQLCANINNSSITQQVIFHAMFGTYVEDLGVLSFMTQHFSWLKRSAMNLASMQRSGKTVETGLLGTFLK